MTPRIALRIHAALNEPKGSTANPVSVAQTALTPNPIVKKRPRSIPLCSGVEVDVICDWSRVGYENEVIPKIIKCSISKGP